MCPWSSALAGLRGSHYGIDLGGKHPDIGGCLRASGAENDVQPGSLLVAINGRPTDELTLPEIRKLLRESGTTVRLRLRRGEEAIRRILKVRNGV